MAGRDITEGRSTRSIAVDLGIVSSSAVWENTDVSYDTAIGGLPFFYAISDGRPYIRQTAPFRKEQFDNGNEPGEQSLTGWWLRSQSSFHNGAGIKFYDPSAGESVSYRFYDSKGVNVWTKGQVTLLKNSTQGHNTTGAIAANKRSQQQLRSIQYGTTDAVLLHDEYDIDKITSASTTPVHFVDYNAGSAYPVYAVCDDGVNAYWITKISDSGVLKSAVYKKPLTGSSASTADETQMFKDSSIVVSNAVMEYVKDRIVLCINNKVFEFATNASALPTAVYTHSDTDIVYSSITASGPAIYVAGYSGIQSSIYKFTLSTAGVMPTLTSAITAAEMPEGEIIHKIKYYLGKLLIGTNKGIRVAEISPDDGSVLYGPLIVETSQPCYDFAVRDKYAWCATSVGGEPGVIRIDLGAEIEPLRYAYANDLYYGGVTGNVTTSCAFFGETNRLAYCTADNGTTDGYVYAEDASTLLTTGYLQTGNIRYNTLEPKNFRRIIGRGVFDYGSMTIDTVTEDGTEYEHITYDSSIPAQEVSTTQPEAAQEFVAFKFTMNRDGTTSSLGPTFKGYQVKATIATPRQRVLKFPVYCYDVETDRFNVVTGYEGRALDRLRALENAEAGGDVLNWQDLTTSTGESRQVTIEQLSFTRLTPPDKRFSGFGGIIEITLRTV
jgi:hypothetical protein